MPEHLQINQNCSLIDQKNNKNDVVSIICNNHFIRDCLKFTFRGQKNEFQFSVLDEFNPGISKETGGAIIFVAIGQAELSAIMTQYMFNNSTITEDYKVLILSDQEDTINVRNVMSVGACGYVTTSLGLDVLISVVRMVKAGGVYVPPHCFISQKKEIRESYQSIAHSNGLTSRQNEIISFIREGKKAKEIARILSISESTVGVHLKNIKDKVGIRYKTYAT